jgi:uncharacterized protein involved in outer membrane biogenesis
MTRSRRIFRFLLAAAGILSALLVILVFLGPLLLNIKAVRDFAVSELGRRTGVRFSYGRVETTLFPRPRVVLRDAAFDIPGLAQGNIPNLETTPELTPLLRGRVRFGDLLVEGANFRLRIPPGPSSPRWKRTRPPRSSRYGTDSSSFRMKAARSCPCGN